MGQLSLDKIYTPILTTQNGDVPCAGENGELGKYALIKDIKSNFEILQSAIDNISITGCFTPLSTTANISSNIISALNEKINIEEKEIEKIKTNYLEINTFDNTVNDIKNNINDINKNLNAQIENLSLLNKSKIELLNEKINLSDSVSMEISKELKNYIETVLNDINTQIENIYNECTKSKELDNRIKLIEESQLNIQTNFDDLKKDFDVLQKQNKEIIKSLLTLNNKINGTIK